MALRPSLQRWLLRGSDPSVRYRVLRDVLGRPDGDRSVKKAGREIGRTGWAAEILAEQQAAGHWVTRGNSGRELYRPKYIATNWRLIVLSDLGMTRRDVRIARAAELYMRRWDGADGAFGGSDSEVCITGNAVRALQRFGYGSDRRVRAGIDWLLRTQKPDGGWHCFPSKTGTLDGWEAMAAFATIPEPDRSSEMREAVRRGAEFYLERGLLHEGGTRYAPWERLHYPVHYYYDLLVGLDMLTRLGYGGDRRMRAPLDRLERMRNPDGSWDLDALHPDSEDPNYWIQAPYYPFALEAPGRPSRWITATALGVLVRAGRAVR